MAKLLVSSSEEIEFNQSMHHENVVNKWKFLEEMDKIEGAKMGPLIKSPEPLIVLTVGYIVTVCFVGPLMMRNREPFQLKNVIRFYNLLMVIAAWVLYAGLYDAVGSYGSLLDCRKAFSFTDQSASKVYRMANLILIVRLSEFFDTLFFVLRKKDNQVTFLHVAHHAFVPNYAYWILRTAPTRFNVFILLINSLLHIIMYSYYFLATFQEARPASGSIDASQAINRKQQKKGLIMFIIAKLLMFKRYLTQLQISQFISLFFYTIWASLQSNKCGIPMTYIISNLLVALGFFALFIHFYFAVYKGASAATARGKKQV